MIRTLTRRPRVRLNTGEAYCLDLAGAQFRRYVCLILKVAVRALLNHSRLESSKQSHRGIPIARIVWRKP